MEGGYKTFSCRFKNLGFEGPILTLVGVVVCCHRFILFKDFRNLLKIIVFNVNYKRGSNKFFPHANPFSSCAECRLVNAQTKFGRNPVDFRQLLSPEVLKLWLATKTIIFFFAKQIWIIYNFPHLFQLLFKKKEKSNFRNCFQLFFIFY